MNQLEALARHTVLVADTGDVGEIARFPVQDATTNPSLVAKVIEDPETRELVEKALRNARSEADGERAQAERFVDRLFVDLGVQILKVVPGRVSTEVPARLSFDTQKTVEKARSLIQLYDEAGIDRERILIKIASTWEGIRASDTLEAEGIHCNMTLLFHKVQAVAAAEAGATLISPFVGRIYDWFKKDQGVADIPIEEDPGVASVAEIYDYLKYYDFPIQVMGASFRRVGQITGLTGCDLLTISPDLLDELRNTEGDLTPRLVVADAKAKSIHRMEADQDAFRWQMNEDAMATEKLAEGIRRFHADTVKLENLAVRELVAS